jgi:CRISPR-associated protein Cmr3
MTTTTWLGVEPLDTVMVRDGRSFVAGTANRARTATPVPSTLGGVVGAALGKKVNGQIVGPVVQVNGNSIFPMPADIVVHGDHDSGRTTRRLLPVERDDDEHSDLDDEGRLPYALTGDGDPLGGWITLAGLREWLAQGTIRSGAVLDADEDSWRVRPDRPPWRPESRVGLARHWDGPLRGTAVSNLLYAAEHLRPVEDLRFVVGCESDASADVTTEVVPFAGQGRMAMVEADPYAAPFPDPPNDFPDGRLAVYLATPALVDAVRWQPADTSGRLCALAVTGPQPVASATPGRFGATRQLFWAVPAGSVYYLKFDTAADAKDWSVTYHGRLLPAAKNPIVTAGFGTCLTGSW